MDDANSKGKQRPALPAFFNGQLRAKVSANENNMTKTACNKNSITVALSGGVDSAVCAHLLKEKGHDVLGVYFDFFSNKQATKRVEKVAQSIGIDLKVIDLKKEFEKEVVSLFVNQYKIGKTPNPCVVCNPKIKFSKLIEYAKKSGSDFVATGHYAKLEKRGEFVLLKKGLDKKKDQSYFLYRLKQQQLRKIIFPLGDKEKKQVRQYAKKNKLAFDQKESQDVCFFHEKNSLGEFLREHIREHQGSIVDENGSELGKHKGHELFTIGQRRGLNLNGGPFFVIDKSAKKNELVVSKKSKHPKLVAKTILIDDLSWVADQPSKKKKYMIKTRYLGKETPGIVKNENGNWFVELENEQWACAPGQSLVLFDGKIVVGGGIIEKTFN